MCQPYTLQCVCWFTRAHDRDITFMISSNTVLEFSLIFLVGDTVVAFLFFYGRGFPAEFRVSILMEDFNSCEIELLDFVAISDLKKYIY